jgi:uncharacterized protein YjhX (UPF0386 family)
LQILSATTLRSRINLGGGEKLIKPVYVIACLIIAHQKYVEYHKRYREKHREELKAKQKLYYKENKDEIALYKKQYQITHREELSLDKKLYYINNKEALTQYRKLYYINNKEALTQYGKEYTICNKDVIMLYKEKNKKQIAAWNKQYKIDNKQQFKDYKKKRRASINGLPSEKISSTEIYIRDGWICQLCKKRVDKKLKHPHPMCASLDHIVPISKGGPHLKENVQLAHLHCNLSAGTGGVKQLRMFG